MLQSNSFEEQYQLKANFVFAFVLINLFYRFISASILSAIGQPPLLFDQTVFIYQLFLQLHIPQFITSHTLVAVLFDVLWYALPILFLVTLQRRYSILFTILSLIYFLTYNIVTGHHYHGLVGMLVMSLPFWSKNETRFNLLWDGARYYWLYIFASAALWKILRGSAFHPQQLSSILMPQQLNLLLQHPDSFRAGIAAYLIAHPVVADWILGINVLVQLTFAVGFFTKKCDHFLFALAIIFVLGNYLVMGVVSTELLILNFTLLNWNKVDVWLNSAWMNKLKRLYT